MSTYPPFNIGQIQRRRDKLYRRVFRPLGEVTLRGHQLDELVRSLRRHLPRRITKDTLFESVRHLAGRRLDWRLGLQTAWRLAGNLPTLMAGRAVPPWAAQTEEEWVPVVAIQAFLARDPRGRASYRYTLRVLAGTPCPLRVIMFWSHDLLAFLSRRIGFSAPWGHYPYHHGTELVGLRLLAKVDPARSRQQPVFSEYGSTPSMIQWNRSEVLRFRKRRNTECPRNWSHPCHECVVGYEECPGGVHRTTLSKQFCSGCGDDSYFDPDISEDRCLSCVKRERMIRHDN